MNMTKNNFKLFISSHDRCSLYTLRYILQNIDIINDMGVHLSIVKLTEQDKDEEMIHKLGQKGIHNLPALLSHDDKVFEGLNKIQNLFNNNIHRFKKVQMVSTMDETAGEYEPTVYGNNPDLSNFYQSVIDQGEDTDKCSEDAQDDIQKKMAAYQRNVPKHRTTVGASKALVDERESVTGRGVPRKMRPISRMSVEDANLVSKGEENNLDDGDDLDGYVGAGEKEGYTPEDEKMERAYWGNQHQTNIRYQTN
jgi:hypothetical protein